MENNLLNNFSFSFKEVLIEEIALEGLEGTGFDLLWRRIEKRMSSQVTDKMKARFWSFILNCEAVSLYEIPEPLSYVEIKDRFNLVDEETGNLLDPLDYLDGPYEYCPQETDYGSCKHYQSRKLILKELVKDLPYDKILKMYGDKLVMVASIEERWKALAPHISMSNLKDMTNTHYCVLELIGKSRENGQMTVGKTNLTNIVKDPKLMFYNRKHLQDLDLVRVRPVPLMTGSRSIKGLLLRLKRFHQPLLLSMPKQGKMYNIVQHLLQKPNYMDKCKTILEQKFITSAHCKRLSKSENAFTFEVLKPESENKSKIIGDRVIRLNAHSEESSQSDGETSEEPLKCRYQVKVSLIRQAYEALLEAGPDGHSQMELSEILGVEYYTARTICRVFKTKNLAKEIFVDKGKQRIARYVASTSASAIDAKYAEEKKKFFELVDESKKAVSERTIKDITTPENTLNKESDEPPKKKPKLNKENVETFETDANSIEHTINEIKCLDGYESYEKQSFWVPGKDPTMRQLRYANGVLKTMKEHVIVNGYTNLNHFSAREAKEPVMDGKSFKLILHRLIGDGHIKLLKMSWPSWQRSLILICAPYVKHTDSIVQTKYKELTLQMLRCKRVEREKKETLNAAKQQMLKSKDDPITRPLAFSLYPRYMKLQKLHEFLIKQVYFPDERTDVSEGPEGFSSIAETIPEFTVEYVLGNMSHTALGQMYNVKIPQSMLQQKLRNVPSELFKTFLATPTLQSSWRQNLKVLSTLGLLQLIKNPTSASEDSYVLTYEYYVNRRATLIDTTGDWPRENADKQALLRTYHFQSMDDVAKYWSDVHNISINTKIQLESKDRSHRQTIYVPRLREEVQLHDNGQVYGNGLGPCGFDSTFFMDMPKLWIMSHTKLRNHTLLKKPVMKPPRVRRKTKAKTKKPALTVRKPVPIHPVVEGMKRNRTVHVPTKWSKEDDKILMLCKAAIAVLSPTPHPCCVRLRNLVAKDILSSLDPKKTAGWCHKRSKTIETNTQMSYEKDCVMNELRRHPQITMRYEGLFRMYRLQYCGNIRKLLTVMRLPMLELVMILLRLQKSEAFIRKVPCVALNLEDFHNKFSICPSTVNRSYNPYRTEAASGPLLAAIKEGIIVAVMTTYRSQQSPESARHIHAMFSEYPERILRPAIDQLRKSGAVAAREKTMNNATNNFHFRDIAQSSYKVSSGYTRRWICRMNADFADNLMFSLDEDLPKNKLLGNSETNCLVCESQASGVLDLVCVSAAVVSGPEGMLDEQMNVTDMMANYVIKPGSVGWRPKRNINKFSELFEDIDYSEALKCLIRDSEFTESTAAIDENDPIVAHLLKKNKDGSTFNDLLDVTGYDKKTLEEKIKILESQNIVKRLGYFENVIVLTKFGKPWTIKLQDKQIVPSPWLTLDMEVRKNVFLKWAGVIVNKVFLKPGCSIANLTEDELLTTRSAQDICVVLQKYKCIVLKTLRVPEPDLFSETVMPELEDFCPYESVENIAVFPMKDILTRYAYFRKKLLDDEYYFQNTT